jgi:hypothetical protein
VGVPFVRVSGKVIDSPRGAVQAYATIGSRSMGGGAGEPIKPDGSFEFWGPDPGKYTLSAGWGARDGPRTSTGVIQIEIAGSNVDNIELRVAPESDIAGRLLADTSDLPQPNAQTKVTLRDMNSGSIAGELAVVAPESRRTPPISKCGSTEVISPARLSAIPEISHTRVSAIEGQVAPNRENCRICRK